MSSDNGIKNIAIYTRVSTEDQAQEGFSLEAQLQRLRAYCFSQEYKVTGEYIDDGYSGTNTKRPQYQKMFEDIAKWDGILVMKMDRIHRNRLNFISMMAQLKKKEKEFVSMSESLNTSTAMGRFVMGIIQDIAQLESEQTGERTFIGMAQKAKDINAGFMGHRPCFGYKTVKEIVTDKHGNSKTKSHLEPIPGELEIVKSIFELYKDGCSMPQICKKIDLKYSKVHYILKNPIYAGYYKWHNIMKKADIKPIISSTLWDLVQKRKCQEADRGDYIPLLIKDKDVFEIPKEKIKAMSAIRRAKHNISY